MSLIPAFAGMVGLCPAQTFNLRCDPFGQDQQEGAWAVEVNDDGNFIVIASSPFQDSLFYSSVVTSIVVDQQGEVLDVDRVIDPTHATYPGWSNSTAKRLVSGYIIGGSNFATDSVGNWIQHPVLFFAAADGQMENSIDLGSSCPECIGRQAKQAPDGGYVICGETLVDAVQTDAFVIKTDAQGNEEWTQTYGGQWNDYAMAIDRHEGTNYFMGGQRLIGGNKQLWVQCLDDTGGVAWNKVWGSAFGEPNAHLTLAADGHPLVASSWGSASNDRGRKYLAKLDSADGSVLWERQYGLTCACPLFVVQEVVPGGDLIAAGQDLIIADYFGVLLRTTSTGDSLWMRSYQYHDSLVNNGSGLFRDVIPTPDGGFIAVGTALQADPYTQDVWVVKVDSMGCLEPGCNLIQGMDTQITNLRDALTVVPNPVASGAGAQVSITLPQQFTPQGPLRLTVVSSDGRLVHEQHIVDTSATQHIDTPLASGLYHIHLSDATRWISGAKLVVE